MVFWGGQKGWVQLPSGKLSHDYGKSPFLMGQLTISMAIFNSKLLVYQRVCILMSPKTMNHPQFAMKWVGVKWLKHIEAIWALPGSPGSLRHEHPEVVGLGSQRPLRILAFELEPLVPKKNKNMQVTCRRLGWHRHSFVSFPSLWPCHLDARSDIFRCSPLQLWPKIGSSKGCPHPYRTSRYQKRWCST